MIRKLKVLGLATVAVLAMSAVVASAAQATILTTVNENYPVALHAGQTTTHEFVVNNRTLTCTNVTFTHELTAATNRVTVTPKYETCHTIVFGATWPVTVTMNSCDYTLSSTPPPVTIDCTTKGDNIDIHVFTSHANHTAGTSACTYHVGPQEVPSGVTFENTGSGTGASVDVKAKEAPVNVTLTSGSTVTCGPTEQTSKYTGNSTTTAKFGGAAEGIHQK